MKKRAPGVTLRDVIAHIHAIQGNIVVMEKRLSSQIDGLDKGVKSLSSDMKSMEKRLTERIDALEEDLTATMKDSLRIRQFVGMPVPIDD